MSTRARAGLPHAAPDGLPAHVLQAFPAMFGPTVIGQARLLDVQCNRPAPG